MLELWNEFAAPLVEFAFMRRALLACLALSLSAAPIGVFLMLRRMSLTGDAMAHAILPGAAAGYLWAGLSLGAMTAGGIVAGLVVAWLAGWVSRSTLLREDATLASFYLLALALGVFMVSTRGSQVDLLHVLFGSVLGLDEATLRLLVAVSSGTMLCLAWLYRPLVMDCMDRPYLRAASRWSAVAHQAFLGLLVVNLVAGFHAMGTLMAVGFMVLPAVTARLWVRRIGPLITLATAIALLGSMFGLFLSYGLDSPTSPSIVLVFGALYVFSMAFAPHGLWFQRRSLPHREA